MTMNDISQVITHLYNHNAFPFGLIVLALGLVILLNRRNIDFRWKNMRAQYILKSLGQEQISDLKCPDGVGGEYILDRLLLRNDGISLLLIKRYPGRIFCADHIEEWTQMLGQKSYNFKNPLFELDYQIKALSACVQDVPVNGFLFFDHLADFPKGHPQRVVHSGRIPELLKKDRSGQVESHIQQAWNTLQSMAEKQI